MIRRTALLLVVVLVFCAASSVRASTLEWNTFLGGSGNDYGYTIAVDGGGNVYVSGVSHATWGTPIRPFTFTTYGIDAFVAKVSPAGTLLWNTFLGGTGSDAGYGIAVDGNGNIYVGGYSTGTWGSPIRAFSGTYDDAFIAKLDASGTLLWNTFLGGTSDDAANGIAVDGSGNVSVAGSSDATWGSPLRAYSGGTYAGDAFIAKLDASGTLLWSTFLGGTGDDEGNGIAVDGSGNAYVTGSSWATWGSPIRPFTVAAYADDAFVAKLDGSGALLWHTFLGGTDTDSGEGIAVDGSGNAYVTGSSGATWGSPIRPFTVSAYGDDAFMAKLSSSGALLLNTFLGGTGSDYGYAIAVDGNGNVYVTGASTSTWGNPIRALNTLHEDALVAKMDGSGTLVWNTFLGSLGAEMGYGIAMSGSGSLYVTGMSTSSWASPLRELTLGSDAFVSRLGSTPGWRFGDADLGGGWRWSAWLGYYNVAYQPWIYHQQHGWLYPFDDTSCGVHFYYSDMGAFLWTNRTTYPYLYRFGEPPAWLWYLKDTANPRWFYNLIEGWWESLP